MNARAQPEDSRAGVRKAARLAISELFLDTQFDALVFRRLRDCLLATGLSIQELDQIYYDEAAPVLYLNTYAVAGAWAGFDPEWLEERCEAERTRGRPFFAKLRRYWVTRSTIEDWQRLRQLLIEAGENRVASPR